MVRAGFGALFFVGLSILPLAHSKSKCNRTLVSYEQAKNIVVKVPDVIAAAKMTGREMIVSGGGPFTITNSKGRKSVFYDFEVNAAGGGGADNGLVGHYAVNKITAQVLNTGTLTTVVGAALSEAQSKLRKIHCISNVIVVEYSVDWPKGN